MTRCGGTVPAGIGPMTVREAGYRATPGTPNYGKSVPHRGFWTRGRYGPITSDYDPAFYPQRLAVSGCSRNGGRWFGTEQARGRGQGKGRGLGRGRNR
jgi:hypothetical protein